MSLGHSYATVKTAADLNDWIDRHEFTGPQAATVLGLSLDGLKKNRSGARPLSRQTELLMEYFDRCGPLGKAA